MLGENSDSIVMSIKPVKRPNIVISRSFSAYFWRLPPISAGKAEKSSAYFGRWKAQTSLFPEGREHFQLLTRHGHVGNGGTPVASSPQDKSVRLLDTRDACAARLSWRKSRTLHFGRDSVRSPVRPTWRTRGRSVSESEDRCE